jgi:hypothetical protein
MKSDPRLLAARARDFMRRLGREKWTTIAVIVAFLLCVAGVLSVTQSGSIFIKNPSPSVTVGEAAPRDYVVERDFPYVDERATAIKRGAREKLVPPVFAMNDSVTRDALLSYDHFTQSFSQWHAQGLSPEATRGKVQADFPDRLSTEDVVFLFHAQDLQRLLEDARSLIEVALSRGVVDLAGHQDEALAAGAVELRRTQDGLAHSEEVPLDQVLTVNNLADKMASGVADRAPNSTQMNGILALLVSFAPVNCFYDLQLTQERRSRARSEVDPVVEKMARGQVLARRGDIVTEPVALRIQARDSYMRTVDVNGIIGSVLFLLSVFLLAFYLISMRGLSTAIRRGSVVLLLGLSVVYLMTGALAMHFVDLPDWVPVSAVIPTATLSMLVAILISTPVGVFLSLSVSLALLLLTGLSLPSFLFAFLSAVAATAVVRDAERRLDLIRAGLLQSAVSAAILTVLGILVNEEPRRFLHLAAWGAANGFFSSILTFAFLPVFEYVLNAPTRFKLMELSDLNSPIFKRMLSQAPGTYTHSISVANLAETACEAIGANSLLARVSAYYHDIGKVDQADYFIENQKSYNRHDAMKPSLSAAVIKSHVRIGIEKARELRLPQALVDIIAQHHGRGLITFFYNRAMKEGKNPRISRDDYSYPGVRPKTKEAAVLMLADSVEAASRTLKWPTEARLERLVQETMMEKFSSGELGDSNLTLRDLELIRKSFVHILEGYFHTRIEYPKIVQTRSAASK